MKNTNLLAIVARMISQTTGVNWEIDRNKIRPYELSSGYGPSCRFNQASGLARLNILAGLGLHSHRFGGLFTFVRGASLGGVECRSLAAIC